jgi:hypothetical protein
MRTWISWLGCLVLALGPTPAADCAPFQRGDVLVLDGAGTTLWRVDPHGAGATPFSPPEFVVASLFDQPADVAVDPAGHVLVVNAGDGRLVEVDPVSGLQSYAQTCTFDLQNGLVCNDVVFPSAPGGIDADAATGAFYVTTAGGVRRLVFSALLGWGVTTVGDAAGAELGAAYESFSNAVYFVDGSAHVMKADVGTGLFSAPFAPTPGAAAGDVAADTDTNVVFFAQRFAAGSGNCLAPSAIMAFDAVLAGVGPVASPSRVGAEYACPRLLAWTPFTAPASRFSLFSLEHAIGVGLPLETLVRIDEPAGGGDPIATPIADSTQIGADWRALAVYVPEPGGVASELAACAALALRARRPHARRPASPRRRDR